MPKKNVSTPTLTESRAKRTPKPNPKYAVDYVAKLRISPDRKTEDDDDYSPVSKKRNDDDSPRDAAQLTKSTKKKLVKATSTPEPKKPASKANTQTPIMSRLSSLRNMPQRGSPVPKGTPVSSKSSPNLSTHKVSHPPEKKATPTDNKMDSPSSETKTVSSLKRSGKNESTVVQKLSPVSKVTKKGEKVDEIRIVNISDIMKQTETKRQAADDVKSPKKQKIDSEEIEIIDIEEEISVSSALVRPTTRQKSTTVEKPDIKPKPQVKNTQPPAKVQSQISTPTGQKRKLQVISPPNMPTKSNPTLITRAKTLTSKTSPSFKTQENKEELGQVLAKRILRKVVKPTEIADPKNRKEEPQKPKVKRPINTLKIKKVTAFEKWSILNFPQIQPQPARSVLCLSLIKLGNRIKHIKLPSSEWSYRITLQKINKENSDKGEVYTGDIEDCGIQEGEKGNYAPVNITFERSYSNDGTPANRSIVFQNKSFSIHMDGKPCKLIGAPQYIYDLVEIQTLLHIVDQVDPYHSYVDQGNN